MSQAQFTQFGPDPPVSALPPSFQACLSSPSAACDSVVGSLAHGAGWCSFPEYAQTTYCACVNNAIPCPMIAASACANSEFAYRPQDMIAPSGQTYLACKGQPICVNILEVGGSQNVVSGITQQCGTFQNVRNVIQTSPAFAILTLILLIVLAFLLAAKTDDGQPGPADLPPLPPPPGLFGDDVAPLTA